MSAAIGIDLGNVCCCVGVIKNDMVEVVANAMGQRTTPSYVSFTEHEILVGKSAKKKVARNAENTVHKAKTLLGKKFSDPVVEKMKKRSAFKILDDGSGNPVIQVLQNGELKTFTPEKINAILLEEIAKTAEDGLGKKVESAVICVPPYFDEKQLEMTLKAASLANLEVLRTIDEPTAAVYAYGLHKCNEKESKLVFIFDLGGVSLDITILKIQENSIEIVDHLCDPSLGGTYFDDKIVEHYIKDFNRKNRGLDLRESKRSLRKLRVECEKAKQVLSSSMKAQLECDSLFEGIDFHGMFSRARFESMTSGDIKKCIAVVEKLLSKASLSTKDISDVVLVGGSSKIPKLKSSLSSFFEGVNICSSIDPSEVIAFGATTLASECTKKEEVIEEEEEEVERLRTSVGVEISGGVLHTLIERGQQLPCQASMTFTTSEDSQRKVLLKVFEGERAKARSNNLVGKFWIKGIPPIPRGVPQIQVTIKVNEDQEISVLAKELTSGKKGDVQIDGERGRMNEKEIDKNHHDANDNESADEALRNANTAKHLFESLVYCVRNELAPHISEVDKKTKELLSWLSKNQKASGEVFIQQKNSFQTFLETFIAGSKQKVTSSSLDLPVPDPLQTPI